ncbi:MAG: hypothetical protein OHK0037_31600 [Elainellaceae cyanobacterium]
MKLCYRGTLYESAPALKSIDGAVGGKYRGVEWRSRLLQIPLVPDSVRVLTYRGTPYLSGTYCFTPSEVDLVSVS